MLKGLNEPTEGSADSSPSGLSDAMGNGMAGGITEGIDWSEAAGRANASKPLESVREESEAEVEEDKSAVESRADAVNETVNETVKETAKETGTETGTETVKDTPEKPRAASMLELSTGLPREEAAALRTPNQSVSGLEEPSTPKGPAPPTLPPLSQLAMLPPVSTPVREYHAVISHKHVASGLSVRSRESGTLSPSVTMQQVQSPGRASAHAFSGEEPGTPSVAGEGYAPSEGGSYHSVILTSDGVVTPGAEGAAKREWGQEKLDIVFDGDEKAGEHEVEPVETVATC